MLQPVFGFAQDERNGEIELLVAVAQPDRQQVAGAGLVRVIVIGKPSQTFAHQLVVELVERRVFDDGQHVDQVVRRLLGRQQFTVFALQFGVFRLAPH